MACPCFRAGAFFGLGVSVSIPEKRSIDICGLLAFSLTLRHDVGNLTGMKV